MNVIPFDTLAVTKKLEAAKFERGQAESLAEVLKGAMQASDLVTKDDLKQETTGLRNEIERVETSIRNELRQETSLLKNEIEKVRGEIKSVEASLRGELKVILSLTLATFGMVFAALLKFVFF